MMSHFLSTVTRYFGPDDRLDTPGIVVQVINGVGCQLIWAGTTNGAPQSETEQDIDKLVQQGRLGADWACSMTTRKVKQSMFSPPASLLISHRSLYRLQGQRC
jgi:hypothetical protein